MDDCMNVDDNERNVTRLINTGYRYIYNDYPELKEEAIRRLEGSGLPLNNISTIKYKVGREYTASVIKEDATLDTEFVEEFINILNQHNLLDSFVELKERKYCQREVHHSEKEREHNEKSSRKRVRWTEEEDEVLVAMHNQGHKWKDIAPKLVKFEQ